MQVYMFVSFIVEVFSSYRVKSDETRKYADFFCRLIMNAEKMQTLENKLETP